MKRRPKSYYSDIKPDYLFSSNAGFAFVVVVILCAVGFLIGLVAIDGNYNSAISHNESVREFNDLPLSERRAIAKWESMELDEETLLMELKDEPIDIKTGFTLFLKIFVGILVIATSALIFCSYCEEKYSDYFLADLPFGTFYGWFLFFAMFIAWPIIAISAIRMRNYNRERDEAEREEVEKQAKLELSEEEIVAVAQSPNIHFSKMARKAYIRYRVKGCNDAWQNQISTAEQNVKTIKAKINEHGQQIQALQRQYGEAKAELAQLSSVSDYSGATRKQAQEEWRVLSKMRGVARITAHRRGNKNDKIFILVKVRVPYHGDIYDFGDYQITLSGEKFKCTRVRSGVKLNHTSTYPDYYQSDGFCFGSRKGEISDYLKCGKTVEAVTLMIDCLHSVNNGAWEHIPDCFRKVTDIERAKRRLRKAKREG